MKLKKLMAAAALAAVVSAAGCTGSVSSQTAAGGDAGSGSIKDEFADTNRNNSSGSRKEEVSGEESEKLTFEEIEELAKNNVFCVTWYAEDDSFTSGTAFLMDSEKYQEKLLVTAFHFLVPEDDSDYSGADLPEYLQGGQIFYDHSFEATGASIKNCVVMEDAASFPDIDKDVAAFTIQGGEQLPTLPLSTHEVKKGDTVYLLSNLWDTDDVHENCVYECKVKGADGAVVYYELDSRYGTTGASGAPIVNEYGEVIGIHMGTMAGTKVAHSSESFLEQINSGKISDIAYPEKTEEEDGSDTEEGGLYTFDREERVETMFYDIQVDKVAVSNAVGNAGAPEGYRFLTLDIRLTRNDMYDDPVGMYYDDFILMRTGGEYDYPQKAGMIEGQLPDEYTIDSDNDTTGKLIFSIPENEEQVGLCFGDYYYYEDSDELIYGDMYLIELPVEDWSRESMQK
ncbi:MAG: trypsin-like peptidase domain-containing protein [Lachnospiraceae bacterium]|nr:trypsin-like peptidase domain-containing protein [Lachnospiraceae bacterium]